MMASVAIAVLPEDPRDKTERRLEFAAGVVCGIVVALFVIAMLDAYVL